MARRKKKQLFEVFKSNTKHADGNYPVKREEREEEKSSPIIFRAGPSTGRKRSTSGPGRINFSLSPELLAVVVLVFVGCLVLSHIWGHKRAATRFRSAGETSRLPLDTQTDAAAAGSSARRASKPAAALQSPTTPSAASAALSIRQADHFYTLRLISGIGEKSAKELVRSLLAKKYKAFMRPMKGGKGYVVNVGEYSSAIDPMVLRLRDVLRRMEYRGKKQFETCYVERLERKK